MESGVEVGVVTFVASLVALSVVDFESGVWTALAHGVGATMIEAVFTCVGGLHGC